METVVDQTQSQPLTGRRVQRPFNFSIPRLIAWLLLVAMTILFLVPFLWMLSTSLTDVRELNGQSWIPKNIKWDNYVEAFSFNELWGQWALNTIIITLVAVFGSV